MRRVYVGRLGHHVRERDVQRFFKSEGRIREVLMKDGFAFVEFDHSEDAEAAVRHLNGRDLNGERVHVEFAKGPPRGGRDGVRGGGIGRGPPRNGPPPLRNDRFRNDRGRDRNEGHGDRRSGGISYAEKYGPPRNTDFRVIVENLSSRVSWQDLKDLMRQAGEVTFADAHKRERNMGIVDFASQKDMKNAVETLNDTEFHGRRIKVYEDKARRHRSSGVRKSGRSRSRSLSRSYSRSRSRGRYSSSRSRSRDRERERERANSRSRSRSPVDREKASRSRSRSRSPVARDKQRSCSRSRTRSRSRDNSPTQERHQSRSRSNSRSVSSTRSPNNSTKNNNSNKHTGGDHASRSRSRSASQSPARSRSRSPISKKARQSTSPSDHSAEL